MGEGEGEGDEEFIFSLSLSPIKGGDSLFIYVPRSWRYSLPLKPPGAIKNCSGRIAKA